MSETFKVEAPVTMVSPTGKTVSLPASKELERLAAGYKVK